LAKQQGVASLNSFEDADPVDIWGRPLPQALTPTGAYKETKSHWAVAGVGGVHSTVLRAWDNITLPKGRNPAFVHATNERR